MLRSFCSTKTFERLSMQKGIVVLLVLFSSVAAHAQAISIYATSSSNRFSNVQTGSVYTTSGYQEQYANFWASGIGGGLTLNFLPVGPVKLGFDLRGSTRPGTVGADTAMGGLRVAFHPPLLLLKPYLQASGGYVATRTVNVSTNPGNPTQTVGGTFTNKYAAWEILGGVDVPILPILDLRVIEVGGGTGISAFGTSSGPNLSLFTVNSGLVLHF
jgi:hypothetical protein